jgi:SAM-dependent methyltransferase
VSAPIADPYETIARYYDLGTQGFDEDLGLYLGLAERADGTALELGCGTGRIMEPLLAAGHAVTGIDRSEPMLRQARDRLAKLRDSGVLLRGSICRPPLRDRFGLVILAVDTLLHLESQKAQLDCLRAARELLSEDGRLVIDVAAPDAPGWEDWSAGVRPLVLAWSARLENGTRVDKFSTFSADASKQTHRVTELYDSVTPDGMVRRTSVDYSLRFIFPGELDLLLISAGLEPVDRYGNYDLGEFSSGSERQISVVARGRRKRSRAC